MDRGRKSPLFCSKKGLITEKHILDIAKMHLEGSPLFVTGVKIRTGNAIHVFIDGDQGVNIDDCVKLSRVIEGSLDRDREDFSLEVSSHGAERPLVMARQFVRHKGKTLEVRTNEDKNFEGVLTDADQEGITVEETTREAKPVGKGKRTVVTTHRIQYNQIKEARIKLKF
jgi:ribosome maturation factor RimP